MQRLNRSVRRPKTAAAVDGSFFLSLSINSRVCETVETYSEPASRAKAKRDGHSKLPVAEGIRESHLITVISALFSKFLPEGFKSVALARERISLPRLSLFSLRNKGALD